jgi:hypothetical protein
MRRGSTTTKTKTMMPTRSAIRTRIDRRDGDRATISTELYERDTTPGEPVADPVT